MDVAAVVDRERRQLLAAGLPEVEGPAADCVDLPPWPPTLEWPGCLPVDPFDVEMVLGDVNAGADASLAGGAGVDCPGDVAGLVRRVRGGAGELAAALPGVVAGATPRDVVGWVEQLEQARACLAAADQVILAELDRRGIAQDWGYPTTARFLTGELRVRPATAAARMGAATAMGPRQAISGQSLPPLRAQVAVAQTAGRLSCDHAGVIDQALSRLPGTVPVDQLEQLEQILVELATRADPSVVARAGRHAIAVLDPDGAEPRDHEIDRRRGLVITGTDTGLGRISGTLTPEALAAVKAVLSPLGAPHPTDATGPDPRTAPQRLHDALADACARLLRSGTLPHSGGIPTTIIVTVSEPELRTRTGLATTSFGTTIPVARLLAYAAECDYIPVVLNATDGVLAYGRTRRIATPAQTTALIGRDKGCTLPGCQTPAQWCERHHIRPHHDGGPTDLSNLTLTCGYHHRTFARTGWECVMIDGRPHWKPPPHLDPHRAPRRNTQWDTITPSG